MQIFPNFGKKIIKIQFHVARHNNWVLLTRHPVDLLNWDLIDFVVYLQQMGEEFFQLNKRKDNSNSLTKQQTIWKTENWGTKFSLTFYLKLFRKLLLVKWPKIPHDSFRHSTCKLYTCLKLLENKLCIYNEVIKFASVNNKLSKLKWEKVKNIHILYEIWCRPTMYICYTYTVLATAPCFHNRKI